LKESLRRLDQLLLKRALWIYEQKHKRGHVMIKECGGLN
jgi:hypothetical protein